MFNGLVKLTFLSTLINIVLYSYFIPIYFLTIIFLIKISIFIK